METFTDKLSSFSLAFRLKMAYAKVLGLKRSGYKHVWNKISTNHDLAMIGVAGTASTDEFFESGRSTAESLRTFLEIDSTHSVLEIGCGVGRIGKSLAPYCREWIGTDISGEMLRHARNNLKALSNVKLIELRDCTLDAIPDNSIDRLYCSAVFMHLDEWDRFNYISEAYRVLRSGGSCYFDNINLAGDEGWKIFLEMRKHDEMLRPPNISKASTSEELRIYLERAGFEDIKLYPGSHWVGASGSKLN